MRVIKIKEGGKPETINYPGVNISEPVPGLIDTIKLYFINESEKPNDINRNTHSVNKVERITTEKNKDYPHLLNAYIEYEVIQLPNDTIIQNLSNALGEHLNAEYPEWKRTKHNKELILGVDDERRKYIIAMSEWEFQCRKQRDQREYELTNKGILPSFQFEQSPKNNYHGN